MPLLFEVLGRQRSPMFQNAIPVGGIIWKNALDVLRDLRCNIFRASRVVSESLSLGQDIETHPFPLRIVAHLSRFQILNKG